MNRKSSTALLFVSALSFAAVAWATQAISLPFGAWTRASNEPILSSQGSTWESAGTFNPAVILHNGKIVMLYRAQDAAGTSRLGYAESADGIHFTRRSEPVLSPEAEYEKDGGVEDPRLQKFGDTFYLTYTGYNTIVPAKIDGKYWMYWLGTAADNTDQMGLSYSSDLIHWTEATKTPVLPRRPGKFDSRVVEPGPPPILTEQGIVLIYNGADDHLVYRTGVAIFDSHNPLKVLYRSDAPIFSPGKEWEKVGQVPNVVFVEGMVPQKDRWLFYYGGADKYIGIAEADAR
ncbi:MAG: glycosidase [Acidobacteria bacterium]|nr:MAG: glycosidase [Acidobacteriota bacterium]